MNFLKRQWKKAFFLILSLSFISNLKEQNDFLMKNVEFDSHIFLCWWIKYCPLWTINWLYCIPKLWEKLKSCINALSQDILILSPTSDTYVVSADPDSHKPLNANYPIGAEKDKMNHFIPIWPKAILCAIILNKIAQFLFHVTRFLLE